MWNVHTSKLWSEHVSNNFKYLLPSFSFCHVDIHVSQMEMLGDVKGTLFMYVQTQLDAGETCTRKTWRSVGRELKVHSDKLNLIQADGRSPTECLLEYFKTLAKEPTMREFVQALKNCGRNDIARYICNWPWANWGRKERILYMCLK